MRLKSNCKKCNKAIHFGKSLCDECILAFGRWVINRRTERKFNASENPILIWIRESGEQERNE